MPLTQAGEHRCTGLMTALHRAGEHLAAGYMRDPQAPPVLRFAHALASHLRHAPLPPYDGGPLYPSGPGLYWHGNAVEWHYSSCLVYAPDVLQAKLECAQDGDVRHALQAVDEALRDYPRVGGYTHSIPNYRRILQEGLASYRERIAAARARASRRHEEDRVVFCQAMEVLLDAIEVWCARAVEQVRAFVPTSDEASRNQQRLLDALRWVPLRPARSFYEGIVAVNVVLYLDGPDDLGRFDQDLWPFYRDDLARGALEPAQALHWITRLWRNMDENCAWNVALGGLLEDGTSGITELTRLCIKAAEGMRRPNLALRLHRDAPQEIWDAALDCIAKGSGIPALYNEEAYIHAIREAHLGVSEADLPDFAFGGCTELMVHGKSNCGSLEGDINLPLLLVETLRNHLGVSASFEQLLAAYKSHLAEHIRWLTACWDRNQEVKAQWQPQVMRSLLIDDCIDNATEYNAGGARYNWCVVNVMGLANVIDSLAALRELVYERREVTAVQMLAALECDFAQHDDLLRRIAKCPRFGNDDPRADDLAAGLSEFVFSELRRYAPWRGGRYLPACLMFTTYAWYGKPVGATPDGRRAGTPIADSAGAMQGRDTSGPTALLQSVARLRHSLAPGTLVVNARFSHKYFTDRATRKKLIDLIRTYFDLGGMQLQINVVDQAVLRNALAHPELHGDLIIRVGGYSEYWTRLDDDLRRSILERTEHE